MKLLVGKKTLPSSKNVHMFSFTKTSIIIELFQCQSTKTMYIGTLNSSTTIKLTSSQKQNVLVPQSHYPMTLDHQLPPPHYAVTVEVTFHFQILHLPHLVLHLKQKEKHTH